MAWPRSQRCALVLLCLLALNVATAQDAPVAEAKPLPDLKTLLDRARERADAMAELRKSYICREVVTADDFDSKGNQKGTHTDEYQVFFIEKTEIRQHVSHDGHPLGGAAQKKEQERVDKLVADARAHRAPREKVPPLRASSLLKLTTVRNARREMVGGRPTIVFDYSGNPAAKASDIAEQAIKKLAGTIWIDEQDAALVHLTGTLQENFHVMGGMLVNIKKGSRFELQATRVNDEIWFNKDFTAHVDGRILLLKGFDGNAHVTFSDYRKMKTTVTLLPGSQIIGDDGKPASGETQAPQPEHPTESNAPKSNSATPR